MMLATIQQVLRPFFLMCFIMGLGVYPVKQSQLKWIQWISYLSILYSLTIWFVYGYVFFYMLTIFPPKILFHTTTYTVIMGINNFTAITSAILNFFHHKKFQIYMKKLAAVDDTLEKLGTPKTYRKLYIISKKVIIGWIVFVLIINIYDIIWCLNIAKFKKRSWGFLVYDIMNHSNHINEFTDLLFIFLLWHVGTRFDKINDHMHCLLFEEKHTLKYTWRKSVHSYGYFLRKHNYKQTLWTSMHLYLELCRIARELNMIFGMQITFGMVYYLGWLTAHCYYLYRILTEKYENGGPLDIVGLACWLFTCLIRLYAIHCICENVKNKANHIFGKVIHQLMNTLRYADIWNEMYFFVLQVMHHPLEFTGLGLFYLGNKFLQKFFSTILTFVIIMVQLNM